MPNTQQEKNMLDWLGLKEDDKGKITKKDYKPTKVKWFHGMTGTGKTLEVKRL